MSSRPAEAGMGEEIERERAAYEEQLDRITSAEMALQAVISLLSIAGRRLRLTPGPSQPAEQTGGPQPDSGGSPNAGDLEQVRDAIDAVMALMPILERRMPQEIAPLRGALSQLQLAYARASQAAGPASEGVPSASVSPPGSGSEGAEPAGEGEQPGAGGAGRHGPGPAESSGRLWVPGR